MAGSVGGSFKKEKAEAIHRRDDAMHDQHFLSELVLFNVTALRTANALLPQFSDRVWKGRVKPPARAARGAYAFQDMVRPYCRCVVLALEIEYRLSLPSSLPYLFPAEQTGRITFL